MAKLVRAKRNGFWDGHRRRAGAVFPVADDAQESWFEDVGPALRVPNSRSRSRTRRRRRLRVSCR